MQRDLSKGKKPGPRLRDRLLLRLSKGERIDGLWIGAFDDPQEPILRQLREALQFIKTYDPFRYARLTRDLKRIWVFGTLPFTGCFVDRLDACQLNEKFVLAETTTPELLASAIVHEATHARLCAYGVGYVEALRPRIEAVCIRRQLAFAAKLPNGEHSRLWAEHLLAWSDPNNLSNLALSKRLDDWAIAEMRRRGVPNWLLRMLTVVRRLIRGSIKASRWARRILAPASVERS